MVKALDPRVERTRSAVIEAAVAVLTEHGFERWTIDEVAERSGVARSTIYRNWPDRYELLVDSFAAVCAVEDVPDTGSLRDDLLIVARRLASGLRDEAWGHMVPSLISAAEHEPELKAAYAQFTAERRATTKSIMHRAADRGEIISDDPTVEIAALRFGASLFFRRLFTDDPLDDAFAAEVVEATLRELGATDTSAPEATPAPLR